MGRISSQEGSNLEGDEENGAPPSPTLSNSPPSMVAPKTEDEYYRYYVRQYKKNTFLAQRRDQTSASHQKHSATTKQNPAWQTSRDSRPHFSPSTSRNAWRPSDCSDEAHSNGTKKNDVMSNASNSSVAAAASEANENNAQSGSATANLWARLQAAAAAAAAASSTMEDIDNYRPSHGGEGELSRSWYLSWCSVGRTWGLNASLPNPRPAK